MDESEPKWRYLNRGEIIQPRDEYYRRQKNSWREFPYHRWGKPLDEDITIYRRRMTHAEIHGESLLEALKNLTTSVGNLPYSAAHAAIKRAEGIPERPLKDRNGWS